MGCQEQLLKLFLLIISTCIISGSIINQNVERTIDLSSQVAKETIKIVAENLSQKPIKEYVFVVSPHDRKNLAFISAKDGSNKVISIEEKTGSVQSQFAFLLNSPSPTQTIHVEVVYTKCVTPHPEQIKQTDKHLVKYNGQLYFLSPYKTITQKTLVKLASANVVSHTQVKPFSITGNKIKYGPYEDIEGLSAANFTVHFENNAPLMAVTSLERTIELSHWGNIAVKENINIRHLGAKLRGSFSRYESVQSAVKSYKTILPASATGVYYRDSNGNISTSNMKVLRDSVELELRPRFPLFGGWKTQYTLGYNVPSFEYLYNTGDNYLLKMRVIDHIYDDMVIDEATVKIILPEGSSNIELKTPYSVNRGADGLVFTYLDTVGRPVITFSKTNLVENHISDFELKYRFSSISLLQEPFLVITFIFVIFVITILCSRLDFSISNHHHKE